MVDLEGAVCLPSDKLIGGWAKVYRDDRDRPITTRIALNEFSKGQSTWKQMPNNMIRKTAIVNALREAFPEKLSAMYSEEEKQDAPSTQEVINQNANRKPLDITPPASKPETIAQPKQEVPKPTAKAQQETVKEPVKSSEFPTGEPHQQSVFDEGIF